MFDALSARVREFFDPHCAHVDCGEPLGGGSRLPVTLSREASRVMHRGAVEFHAECANAAGLLVPDGEPWTLDQGAVNRALGLVPPRMGFPADMEE